uniref:Glycosyltransferase family 2 protein n=1 Tax=candidate division WOR-3 bacterium TaxID=2052148 RepID=A0A7C2K2M7_UNCW3
MSELDLTCVILTLNEEENIKRAIESVKGLSKRILVIDSGSTDKTVEIAKNLGAECVFKEFVNYAEQRNYALNLVKTQWVLFLDADEVVSEELKKEITNKLKEDTDIDGFLIPRKNWYLGTFLKCWSPDRLLRLFKKDKGIWKGEVHEKVEIKGKVGILKNPILHYPFKDLYHQYSKNLRYAKMLAEEKSKRGEKATLFDLKIRPILNFLKHYLLKGCIFEGKRGLIFSLFYLQYTIQKYSMLSEKQILLKRR